MTSGFRKVPAKYKVCPTDKGLLALTNFEINSPRKLINSCLFLLMLLQSAETIVDVFDRYDLKDSIKSAERECRSQAAGGHMIYHVNEGNSIPDWKKFLSINRNKQELISFLGEFISKFVNANNPLPVGQTLYLRSYLSKTSTIVSAD
jgi:hypothetical protein